MCKRFKGALQSAEALRGISVRVGWPQEGVGWHSGAGGLVRMRSLRGWLASGYGEHLHGLSLWIEEGKGEQRQLALAVNGCLATCTQLHRLQLTVPYDWAGGWKSAAPFRLPASLTTLCLSGCAARVRCST